MSQLLDEISLWFFWRYFWDLGTLATNDSEFHVFLSVCLSAYFLTKIILREICSSGWDILLECFGDISEILVFWFQIVLNFCMSITLVVGILPYSNQTNLGISPVLDEISFWIFMDTFLGYWYNCSKLFWISILKFKYICVFWI